MHRSVAPSLVEEPARAIQMVEVRLVLVASEELHIADLEIRPEVARRVAVCVAGMVRAEFGVRQPVHHVVLVEVGRVRGEEFLRGRPEVGDTLRGVEEVNREAVGDVVILHVSENVVVDIAEVLDLGLDAPVVAVILQGGVFVEHAAVPAAHLAVGHLVAVLDVLFGEHGGRLAEEVHVDPFWDVPVFLGHEFWDC